MLHLYDRFSYFADQDFILKILNMPINYNLIMSHNSQSQVPFFAGVLLLLILIVHFDENIYVL